MRAVSSELSNFQRAAGASQRVIADLAKAAEAGKLTPERVDAIVEARRDEGVTMRGIRELGSFANLNADLFTADGKARLRELVNTQSFAHLTPQPVPTTPRKDPVADPKVADVHAGRVQWRAYDIAAARGGVDPLHPVQGWLPDCFLDAALIAVALQQPEAITRALHLDAQGRPQRNDNGNLTATFHTDGGTETLEFDEDLPTVNGGLIYTHSRDPNVVWPALLEKAFTMWEQGGDGYGGYAGGDPTHVMTALTGGEGGCLDYEEYLQQGDGSKLYAKLKDELQAGSAMVVGTREDVDRAWGLVPAHAYAVMGVGHNDELGAYIELQNPFHQGEPGGDGVDDGRFKIRLDDFGCFFDEVHVANKRSGRVNTPSRGGRPERNAPASGDA
jgi:hypothetical protein